MQLARDYAEANQLDLQEAIADLGVSTFRGRNNRQGALAGFLEAVRNGHIAKGSWLLVESVDRLSRQEVFDAFDLFSELITNGIVVATLQDNQVYTRESLVAGGQIYMLIAKIQLANEESEKKSKRSRAAWDAGRAGLVEGKKIRNLKPPSWLVWDKTNECYSIIESKHNDVQYVFELAISGMGGGQIAKRLNEKNIPMLTGKKANWSGANVVAVLRNKAVIGEYTPMRKCSETNKRIPLGQTIADYYPPIIKREMFFTVQRQIDNRNSRTTGYRKNKMINLFSGVLRCAECSAPLTVKQKYRKELIAKYGEKYYLGCSRKMENKCDAKAVNYEPFEVMMRKAVATLPTIINQTSNRSVKQLELKEKRNVLETELQEIEKNTEAFMIALAKRPESEALLNQLDKLEVDKIRTVELLADINGEIEALIGNSAYRDKFMLSLKEADNEQLASDFDTRVTYNQRLKDFGLLFTCVFMHDDFAMIFCKTEDGTDVCSLTFERDFSRWEVQSSAGVIVESVDGNEFTTNFNVEEVSKLPSGALFR